VLLHSRSVTALTQNRKILLIRGQASNHLITIQRTASFVTRCLWNSDRIRSLKKSIRFAHAARSAPRSIDKHRVLLGGDMTAYSEVTTRGAGAPITCHIGAERQFPWKRHMQRMRRFVDVRAEVVELEMCHEVVLNDRTVVFVGYDDHGIGFLAGISELVEINSTTNSCPAGTTVERSRSTHAAAIPLVSSTIMSLLKGFMI